MDFPRAAIEIEDSLLALELPVLEIVGGGGGETKLTQRLRKDLAAKGWNKRNVNVRKLVSWGEQDAETEVSALSHEIDHVKAFEPNGKIIALEIEWNNKDPFFDRDLESFKRLHAEGAISVAGLITRGSSLQSNMRIIVGKFAQDNQIADFDSLKEFGYSPTGRQKDNISERAEKLGSFRQAWVEWFVSDKFGEATTHWRKLQDRVLRGVGNPCPLILFGIPDSIISFDYSTAEL